MGPLMSKGCPYEILEAQQGGPTAILSPPDRKLAMKFHPDKNPGDDTAEVNFKEINEAYRRPQGRSAPRRL